MVRSSAGGGATTADNSLKERLSITPVGHDATVEWIGPTTTVSTTTTTTTNAAAAHTAFPAAVVASTSSIPHGNHYNTPHNNSLTNIYSNNYNNNSNSNRSLLAMDSIRHVTRVSKRAALATKEQFWDSNDAAVEASQKAVDQWEQGYNALRGLLQAVGHSAQGLYGAAKAGAGGLEHGLLVPVRDWVLLPAFGGIEHVVSEATNFLQSDRTQIVARQSLSVAKQVPWIGERILVPSLCISANVIKTTWHVLQYPIPSPQLVRESVDTVLTGTKWALTTAGTEVFLYVKRADANITRTLSHTQWKVLGSGPYHTLDKLNKRDVIDHLCERYFATQDPVSRYELAAHVRAHNRPLYHDLVLTGLLRERGGSLTVNDEWLSPRPLYRTADGSNCFLLDDHQGGDNDVAHGEDVFPLWFRLAYQNGQRPKRDTQWVCFDRTERKLLEDKYRFELQQATGKMEPDGASADSEQYAGHGSPRPTVWDPPKYPTNAQWLFPDLEDDLLLDQKRHAVSFFPCCPKCHQRHEMVHAPLVAAQKQLGELCEECAAQHLDAPWVDALLSPPPLEGVYRPTMWRYYGPGDELRRATWFLDTQRNGPQPYGDDAQAVLEDAYLFLKWISQSHSWDGSTLLTVQVPSPDGSENQLVQFSALTSATAIGKGLGGAISIFKRRVYRGAYFASEGTGTVMSPPQSPERQEHKPVGVMAVDDFDPDRAIKSITADDSVTAPLTLDGGSEDPPKSQTTSAASRWAQKGPPLALELKVDETPSKHGHVTDRHINSRIKGDEVDHLVLVVHGIGEMMQSFDFFGLKKVPTIVECCGFLRENHAEVLDVRFAQVYQAIDGMPETRFGRVEYLPVEWHESFSIHSARRQSPSTNSNTSGNCSINDISLRTIPNMRQFANDTLMDVLYFMSPDHHATIIDIVVSEMNYVVNRFRKLTGFEGNVSVVGHSLGSIVAWDILDHQRPDQPETPLSNPELTPPDVEEQRQIERAFPQLDFSVDNAFMLGSPIPVFLMIRNQQMPLTVDFKLQGCSRVFNIFHPFDPVSYRIEPLLHPSNADVDPKIMTHWNGGYRFQYQTKRLWEKLVDQTLSAQESVVQGLESGIAALGLLDSAYDGDEEGGSSREASAPSYQVVTGQLNGGRRIDYMLQEKELDRANEYVAAFAAHSCYWLEKDLSLFIARQICLVALERAAGRSEEAIDYTS